VITFLIMVTGARWCFWNYGGPLPANLSLSSNRTVGSDIEWWRQFTTTGPSYSYDRCRRKVL